VRVQAKRLRTKLQEYYETEGKSDKVLIEIPKGHYSVIFCQARNVHADGLVRDTEAETGETSARSSPNVDKEKTWRIALILAVIVLAVSVVALTVSNRNLRKQIEGSISINGEVDAGAVWKPFLSSSAPTLLVLSNPAVYRFSNAADPDLLMKRSVELTREQAGWLAEALKDRFVMRQNRTPRLILAPADYTGVGEAIGLQRVADLFRTAGKSITLKQSRTVSAEDMKRYNVISLGSVWANDWSGKLPIKEDFTYSVNATIVNTSPEPGEEKEYSPRFNERTGDLIEDYGLITVKPGVTDETTLMILAGIKSEGTQAAAEYVTNKEYLNILNQRLQQLFGQSGLPKYYQVLLKVDVDNGIPITASILTIHRLEVTRNQTDH
jgi:PKD repeat protein